MTDLASLVLAVDSTQVKTGTKALDGLTVAGARAEVATTGLGKSSKTAAIAAAEMAARAQASSRATLGVASASVAAQRSVAVLSREVGTLTAGMATGSIGAQGMASSLGQITLAAVRLPGVGLILGVIAAAAALAAGAIQLFQSEVAGSGETDKFIQSLGLTAKEMKKLKDTGVTLGDTMKGVWKTISDHSGVDESLKSLKDFAIDTFKSILRGAVVSFAEIYGTIVGVYKASIIVWKGFPAAIGDIFVSGVNLAIAAIESLLNKSIGAVNALSSRANSIIGKVPGGIRNALGIGTFGQIGAASLGRVANNNAGAASRMAGDASGAIQAEQAKALAAANTLVAETERNIIGAQHDRLKAQADEIIADRAGAKAKKEHADKTKKLKEAEDELKKAAEAAIKSAENYLEGIRKETDSIGQNEVALKRMEVATAAAAARKAAAVAPTKELRAALIGEADAIQRAGEAWERVYGANKIADYIKNTVEPLEQQAASLGLSAEAQARFNLEAEKGAIVAEYGTAAWERYAMAQSAIIADQFKVRSPFEEWAATIPQTAGEISAAFEGVAVNGVDSIASSLVDVIQGTKSLGDAFSQIAQQIIADILQMTIRMLIFKAISAAMGGGGGGLLGSFGPFAKGGAFSGGNVIPFASGGIVGGPTMFPMSGGRTGLMGEAGPEAVMPLARDGQGRLGVRGANTNEPIRIELDLNNEMLEGKIIRTSNAVVEIKRKGIVNEATAQTARGFSRPKLMGR